MATAPNMRSNIGPHQQQQAENDDNLDPERLLQCPFDRNHQIRSCRFPYHLIKCRKNHPELANKLKTCPYNARHLVPKHELERHTETCANRISVDTEDDVGRGWHVPVSTWTNPNSTEDWEREADPAPTPFVLGETSKLNQILASNNLGTNVRAPTNLPWSRSHT